MVASGGRLWYTRIMNVYILIAMGFMIVTILVSRIYKRLALFWEAMGIMREHIEQNKIHTDARLIAQDAVLDHIITTLELMGKKVDQIEDKPSIKTGER